MPLLAAKRKIDRSWALPTHWVIDADPAAGVMILARPLSPMWRAPALATPVLARPMAPARAVLGASPRPIRAAPSFLAPSSRSAGLTFALAPPPRGPPAALFPAQAGL